MKQWIGILLLSGTVAYAAPKPNIIVILADDMGFSDLGCYGSEIPTPNLDALAADGLRFTRFYNTGRCSPSRTALLTGLYSQQAGIGLLTEDKKQPGYRGQLNDQCVTLAEVLGSAGYFTAISGKWHVGHDNGKEPGPWVRGFQRSLNAAKGAFYYGHGNGSTLFLDGEEIAASDERLPENWYVTDLWTTYSLKFIDEAIQEEKPFMLYLPHIAPHFPLQAPADEIEQFRGNYKMGWDELRKSRYAKQIELGIIDESWPLSKRPDDVPAWDSLSAEEQDRFDHMMAVYAAVVAHLDKSIGDLVSGLKERGVLDNTLILFMSDNGGSGEPTWKGLSIGDPTQPDSRWLCGAGWAYAQCTPFYRYKRYNHEGGISTPLIAHWPAGIVAKGELRNQMSHLIDVMPTVVELGGATYPEQYKGHQILPMEGTSLVPTFGNKPLDREVLYWEHMRNAAMRVGDMKLVREGGNGAWELYDMAKDRTEQNNLARKHPEQVQTMAAKWNIWANRANVLPYPGGGKANKSKKSESAKRSAD
jgi:arylsulfatase